MKAIPTVDALGDAEDGCFKLSPSGLSCNSNLCVGWF